MAATGLALTISLPTCWPVSLWFPAISMVFNLSPAAHRLKYPLREVLPPPGWSTQLDGAFGSARTGSDASSTSGKATGPCRRDVFGTAAAPIQSDQRAAQASPSGKALGLADADEVPGPLPRRSE